LIQANELLKTKYDELLRENGALQNQVQILQTEIDELKERRVKASNENIKIWEHIVDGKPHKSIKRSECVHCHTQFNHDHLPWTINKHLDSKACMKSRREGN
jgi:FtsZ-binding cell division protein ZapB